MTNHEASTTTLPYTGDRPVTDFASDDDAYAYAREYGACTYDADYQCVYCKRWDH